MEKYNTNDPKAVEIREKVRDAYASEKDGDNRVWLERILEKLGEI